MYHNVHIKREHESKDFTSFNQFNNSLGQIKLLMEPVLQPESKSTKIKVDAVYIYLTEEFCGGP